LIEQLRGALRPSVHLRGPNMSFAHQRTGKRATTLIAGPLAGLLLAIGLFATASFVNGRVVKVARAGTVEPGGPAEMAGVLPGDVFLSIDGRPIESFADVQRIVQSSVGPALTIIFDRGGERVALNVAPALREIKDSSGNVQQMRVIGVGRSSQPGDVQRVSVPLLTAAGMGLQETWDTIKRTCLQVVDVLSPSYDVFSGPVSMSIAPPIPASTMFYAALTLAASFSVILAALTLFSNLLWRAIEVLRKRPVSDRTRTISFCMTLLGGIMLSLLVTMRDLP
jgi:regulator of sigma E protease